MKFCIHSFNDQNIYPCNFWLFLQYQEYTKQHPANIMQDKEDWYNNNSRRNQEDGDGCDGEYDDNNKDLEQNTDDNTLLDEELARLKLAEKKAVLQASAEDGNRSYQETNRTYHGYSTVGKNVAFGIPAAQRDISQTCANNDGHCSLKKMSHNNDIVYGGSGGDDNDGHVSMSQMGSKRPSSLQELVRAQRELEYRENHRSDLERTIDRMELERLKAERIDQDRNQLRQVENDVLNSASFNYVTTNSEQHLIRHQLASIEQDKIYASGSEQQLDSTSSQSLQQGQQQQEEEQQQSFYSSQVQSQISNRPQNLLLTLTNRALDLAHPQGEHDGLRISHPDDNAGTAASHEVDNHSTQRAGTTVTAPDTSLPLSVWKDSVMVHQCKVIVGLLVTLVGVVVASILLLLLVPQSPFANEEQDQNVLTKDEILLRSMKENLFPETKQALLDPTTPQSQAFQWLQDDMTKSDRTFPEWRLRQRFALATVYLTLYNTLPHHERVDECQWFFAFAACQYQTGQFETLEIPLWNVTTATLPAEVALLSQLTTLAVVVGNHDNDDAIAKSSSTLASIEIYLRDMLPTRLGVLSDLQTLTFVNANIQGTIPTYIGGWSTLQSIDASYNNLTRSIPTEWKHLTQLKILKLNNNQLTGSLPSSEAWWESLAGTIETFWVNENDLSGTIPSYLGLWTNVQYFSIANNAVLGTIPTEIGLCQNLVEANFQDDHYVTGRVPDQIRNTFRSLSLLDLRGTNVTEIDMDIICLADSMDSATRILVNCSRVTCCGG